MSRIHANNFITTLNGSISSGATSIVLTSVAGFPVIGAGVTCNVTLANGSSIEIVTATARSSSTLTVTRAAEGTTATAFASGSTVSIRPTADSIDRKLDIAGSTSTTTLGTVTTGTWHATPVELAYGGTNANLTASNGGVFYSTASAGAILSGTATAGLPLISGSTAAPTWGTLNGSGNLVATTSPALVTPALGTVASGVISACTSTSMVMVTPVLGTPTSGNLSNCTAYALSALTGAGTGVLTFLATPSSANLISAITDETGTGALVFANTPTLVTPILGTVTSGNISACTSTSMVMVTPVLGTPTSGNISNCTSTSMVLTTPVLGTPTSGTLTNCTGLTVAGGGTGIATQTAYSVLVGGTTATGAMQSLASIGSSGQVLTSAGPGALPTWTTLSTPVTGPGSATDKAVAIYNGTGGSTIQNSLVIITSGAVTGVTSLTASSFILAAANVKIWQGLQNDNTSTGCGTQTLNSTNNASATNNSGFGYLAGNAVTTGAKNTCVGASSGGALSAGSENTFVGYVAGGSTNGSSFNTSIGSSSVTGAGQNTCIGALAGNTGASGGVALSNSGGAADNTLIGYRATCDTSTAIGCLALGEDAVAAKATGTTSITIGPGIAIGSAARPVGFAGDGTMIQTAGSSSGYWRVKVNGTHYKILMFADS